MFNAVVALGVAWVGANGGLVALLVRRARRLGRLGRQESEAGVAGRDAEATRPLV
jgi:hypothetical protein